jgi:DNA-binding YbaB/EbfC family protein
VFKGLGNLAGMLKLAQTIGARMGEVTERLKQERVSGSAGGQMIVVHASGLGEILQVEIDPQLSAQNDLELIRDLLPTAINDALAKAKQRHVEVMKELTGGMDLPGLDDAMKQLMG